MVAEAGRHDDVWPVDAYFDMLGEPDPLRERLVAGQTGLVRLGSTPELHDEVFAATRGVLAALGRVEREFDGAFEDFTAFHRVTLPA